MPGSDNPFAGRLAVKIVSVCDLLLAATLLCYYGYRWVVYEPRPGDNVPLGKGPFTLESAIRSYYIAIFSGLLFTHSLQFVMSLVLLSSAYDRDAEEALGKCQLWWCSSSLLFWSLAVEALGTSYMMISTIGIQPVAMSVFIVKLIFRLTAVVNVRNYMNNLKKAPPTSVHEMVHLRSKTKGPPPSNYIKY